MPSLTPEQRFRALIPTSGWLAEYVEWTEGSEAPLPYHFFVGLSVIGAALKRKTWFSKGYYKIYPNEHVILVGPTGVVRKTSAINLGVKILRGLKDINIVSKKITPEAIIDALVETGEPAKILQGNVVLPKEQEDACAVIVATELAVFLGKQKYNEGMIALLTDLFDSPDEWSTQTRGRGKVELKNVGLVGLWASTPDWMITAIPHDAFGGGFMRRLLFVVQETTDRCFPIPEEPPPIDKLVEGLRDIRSACKGVITFSDEAMDWYVQWYATSRGNVPEDEKMAGYHESKPDHMIRLSMNLAASERRTKIDLIDIKRASRILNFLEEEMLYTFKWLGMRPIGQDQERIVRTLKAHGGKLEHHELLRRLIFFMNALQFRNAIITLTESRIIKETVTSTSRTYTLIEDR